MRSPVPTTTDDQLDDIKVRQRADRLLALHESREALHAELKGVLLEARAVIAGCLRASAPDWFGTEADIARHVTIQRIDAALANLGVQP